MTSSNTLRAFAAIAIGATLAFAGTSTANAAPHHTHHAYGLDLNASKQQAHPRVAHTTTYAAVPNSASLMKYALPAGDQGQVGSCVTWATGYTAYGILMKEKGISGAPMAPLFIYSQIVDQYNDGVDRGTTAGIALPMEQQEGIDTQNDYWQGTQDYWDLPDQNEYNNAAHYKLSGFTDLMGYDDEQTAIKQAIASGKPVTIGFQVRSSFDNITNRNYDYEPSSDERVEGGHEVTIVGYDSNGVVIENSWGSNWGHNGYFTTSWDFLLHSGDVTEVYSMDGVTKA